MLDIKFVRENTEKVKEAITAKKAKVDLVKLFALDEEKRAVTTQLEQLRAQANLSSKAKPNDQSMIVQLKQLKTQIKKLDQQKAKLEAVFSELMYQVPNVLLDDVPRGADESANKILRQHGAVPKFDFAPRDHMQLGEALDIIDIPSAARITGTRFAYLKGQAVLLQFALIQFTLDFLTDRKKVASVAEKIEKGFSSNPFIPVLPPVMIRPEIFSKMGRLTEQDKEERYYLPKDDLYLIGSAEHTLGPLHLDSTFEESQLPVRYLGFSTSFRREAGSYGRDTRGILRVHQFDKLEMESFCLAENSVKEQEFIIALQERMMQELELPYQVVLMCAGETSMPDSRQIDIETWMPGQGKYRETHTSDLMTDFQARRLNTKVRRKSGRSEFVHMNDATAFAIGRSIIAILENYQQKDG
ncbi:MAG: serine--tRNA ligase, partial [Candidatus Doudnabacteria bacterium]|nr:serine--tRNA ligase [Candidatus Doudnabacteria bacterium]